LWYKIVAELDTRQSADWQAASNTSIDRSGHTHPPT